MTDEALDRLGPVDYLVVEFPVGAQNFTGEAARELARLHESGTIRVMDLLILVKDADGSVEAHELSDLADDIGDLSGHRGRSSPRPWPRRTSSTSRPPWTPAAPPASSIFENLWAAPFASAVRHAGGQLIANGRIPVQAIIAAIQADAALEAEGV